MGHYETLYQRSISDPEGFWAEQAQAIDWFQFPDTILSQDEHGLYRWYEGGMLNTCHLALDYHVANGRGDQTALIYDSPVTQTFQKFTYRELLDETARFAGALSQLGVGKGDRVIIYMPMVPQVVVGMLACARLGAIHSVVFGGFAPHELALRIDDAQPKVILTSSAGVEFDKIIPYQPILESALREASHQVEHVVWHQRWIRKAEMTDARYLDWELIARTATPVGCTPVAVTFAGGWKSQHAAALQIFANRHA